MLLSIKVFTDLLGAKIVQKLTGVIYFQFPTFIDLYQYRSVANGGMAVFRVRFTALSEYCRSHGRI